MAVSNKNMEIIFIGESELSTWTLPNFYREPTACWSIFEEVNNLWVVV